MKQVYYKKVKIAHNLEQIIEGVKNIVVKNYTIFDSNLSNIEALIKSKFYLSFSYFLVIKWSFFTSFYSLINGQMKRYNKKIKIHFGILDNLKQIYSTKLLLITLLIKNNAKYWRTSHKLFAFWHGYFFFVSFEQKADLHLKLQLIYWWIKNFSKLIIIYYQNFIYTKEFPKLAKN